MRTNPVIIGLIIAGAALGLWMARINSSLGEANAEIATLNKKLAVAEHNASVARAQSMKPVVEYVSTSSARGNEGQAQPAKSAAPVDPRTALAQAQAMPAGAGRNNAILEAVMAMAATDPQAAWGYATNLPDDGSNFRLDTLKGILKAWSAKDPAQAAAKLATLSMVENSASATNASGVIAANWLKQDPEAASKWVDTLPPGNARDSAVMAVVEVASQNDLPTAFNWATTMSDPSKRGSLITGIVRQWAKTDPDAATKAVLAQYTNNNNGRQATLLGIIQQVSAETQANAAANGSAP